MKTVHHLRRGSRRRCTPEDSRQRGLSLFLEHLDLHAVHGVGKSKAKLITIRRAYTWRGYGVESKGQCHLRGLGQVVSAPTDS